MMHIAFTIDNRFVRPCAVTMVSVLRNNVPYEIVFHVIGLNLHQEDVAFFSALCDSYGAKVFFYEVAEEKMKAYEVTWEKQRLSKVVFFRCLLSSILPMSVSKVLYLDCDVLVLSSLYGLRELLWPEFRIALPSIRCIVVVCIMHRLITISTEGSCC